MGGSRRRRTSRSRRRRTSRSRRRRTSRSRRRRTSRTRSWRRCRCGRRCRCRIRCWRRCRCGRRCRRFARNRARKRHQHRRPAVRHNVLADAVVLVRAGIRCHFQRPWRRCHDRHTAQKAGAQHSKRLHSDLKVRRAARRQRAQHRRQHQRLVRAHHESLPQLLGSGSSAHAVDAGTRHHVERARARRRKRSAHRRRRRHADHKVERAVERRRAAVLNAQIQANCDALRARQVGQINAAVAAYLVKRHE